MRKWVTRHFQAPTVDAMDKAKQDFAKIAHSAGYEYLDIRMYRDPEESYREIGARIDGITAGVEAGDLVIFQYPIYNSLQFEVSFAEHLIYRGTKLVLMVHDYERLRFGGNDGFDEIRHLNLVSAVIVPNEKMRDRMREDGVTSPIILQYCWDYLTDNPIDMAIPSREVVIAGSFVKSSILSEWNQDYKLIAYGSNDLNQTPAENVDYRGVRQQEELIRELPNCFGLAWDTGTTYGEYTRYNNPYKVAMYLSLGMPVIVWKESAIAKLITDNGLGYTINSLDEIGIILSSVTDEELSELKTRVVNFSSLLRNGFFGRRFIVETEKVILDNNLKIDISEESFFEFGIKVLGIQETIHFITDNHLSTARFGDGEFELIQGQDIPFQQNSEDLRHRLEEVLYTNSNKEFLVCLPDVFSDMDKYKPQSAAFWKEKKEKFKGIFEKLNKNNVYGSAFMSRPYMDLIDKSKSAGYFNQLKDLWFMRDILIVEGSNTRSGRGNDLFDGARSVERIICPPNNAFDKIDEIEQAIRELGKDKLVLLMLGPTAKIVAYDLYKEGLWLVDLGHIDTEYEWFKMGATEKVKLPNKHTAEHNYDQDIELTDDPEYNSQIVADLTK